MGRQSGTRFLYKAGFEVHEIKGITDLQDPVKLFLWHDFSVRAPALARASAGKPWLGDGGKCIGMHVTEKGAIGRIGYRRLIAAQMRGNSVGYDGVAGNVTAWFRAIAHQSRCVGQKNRTPRMTGCSRVCVMALLTHALCTPVHVRLAMRPWLRHSSMPRRDLTTREGQLQVKRSSNGS